MQAASGIFCYEDCSSSSVKYVQHLFFHIPTISPRFHGKLPRRHGRHKPAAGAHGLQLIENFGGSMQKIALLRRVFGRKGNVENSIITFILTLYLIIVSTTDNTMNYPLLTGVLAMLMMGNGFEENVRCTENKMFGYISKANQKEERETLL